MSDQVPPSKDVKQQTAQERRLMGLAAFDRHQWLMKDAIKYYRAKLPPEQQTVKSDFDVLKEQYRCAARANFSAQAWLLLLYMTCQYRCNIASSQQLVRTVHMLLTLFVLHTICIWNP